MTDLLHSLVASRTVEEGDCLLWQGRLQCGHPAASIDGKTVLVRRELWIAKHGAIPAGKVLRCTCGEQRCVNIAHAKPMTYQQIALIEGAAGKMSGPIRSAKIAAVKRAGKQAKVTAAQVREFRASGETGTEFARRTGITVSTACRIRNGTVWRDHTGPFSGLVALYGGAGVNYLQIRIGGGIASTMDAPQPLRNNHARTGLAFHHAQAADCRIPERRRGCGYSSNPNCRRLPAGGDERRCVSARLRARDRRSADQGRYVLAAGYARPCNGGAS